MRIECPSGLIIEARKPQGGELKALARATEQRDAGTGLAEVLRGCWQSTEDPGPYGFIGAGAPDVKRVVGGDILVMLLHLRKSVLGATFEFHVGCEHCGAKNELTANLDGIETTKLPETSAEVMRVNGPLECTTLDGRVVRYHLSNIRTQEYLRDQTKQMKRRPEWAGHTATMVDTIASQITFVDGLNNAKGENVSNEFVKRLQWLLKADVDVIYDLREKILESDCGVDTDVEFTCTECRWEQNASFPLGSAFFGPRSPKKLATEETEISTTTTMVETPTAATG